ncbi:MAG: PAS domain-containing sensor histidine kinase [Proteobacteria bacterium]|nr:PAS domain-containing sensor histidine kinase [Pseudomonadota bacterium]
MSNDHANLDRLTREELIALVRSIGNEPVAGSQAPTDAQFRRLADDSIQGMVVHSEGRPLYANRAFADLLGLATPAAVLTLDSILGFFVPENRERVRDLHRRRLAGDDVPNVFEHPLVRIDGSLVWIESRITRTTWDGVPAVQVAVMDITAKHQVEVMKDEFVSTVSHELRTPLTSISGALSLIASGMAGPVPVKQRELIDIAANNSERLVRLITDILDVQSIEGGGLSLEITPHDADAILQETLELNRPFLNRHNASASIVGRTGGHQVLAERDKLVQALTNLLSNAAKFSDGAAIELSVRSNDALVEFRVADFGPGILPDLAPKLFSRFTRGHLPGVGGTGLGLYISRCLIEAQGGDISYAPGAPGSVFTVRLPCAT